MKPSDKYLAPGGAEYVDKNDVYYESLEDLLFGMMNFCGCGSPDDALDYILAGLLLVEHDEARSDKADQFFGSAGAKYFFWYWLDAAGFMQHGISVPGWLSEEGAEMLALLQEWKSEVTNG